MLIKKFRIKNYKSIVDSGDCYPEAGLTVFAGKNEAGKSSILEALADFSKGKGVSDGAIRIDSPTSLPEISVTFVVEKEEAETLFKALSFSPLTTVLEQFEFTFIKKADAKYSFNTPAIFEQLGLNDPKSFGLGMVSYFLALLESIEVRGVLKESGVEIPPLSAFTPETSAEKLAEFKVQISPFIPQLPDETRSRFEKGLAELEGHLNSASENVDSPARKFATALLEKMPSFILFSTFNDVFPHQVPLAELESNEWIKDLSVISDLDTKIILGSSERDKKRHKRQLNLQMNDEFTQFWTQDAKDIEVDWDNQKLMFWIVENEQVYEPAQRSQGSRWHLAFFVRITARARDGLSNVILIDEPGLYLHAKAQQDILHKLEDAANTAQVMFTTHSPYLISADKLERVRLVLKTPDQGTTVENKVHKVSDKETLTPILTAIGLEMSGGIANAGQANNVVVEGPSDYFYLNAFKGILQINDVNIVSGGASGNMPKVGTILQGWGCRVIYLYDNDQAFKDNKKHIKSDWRAISPEMLKTLPKSGSIEDLFSKADFAKFVADVPVEQVTGSNSEFFSLGKNDKVLKARLFLTQSRLEKLELSKETEDNFRATFAEIAKGFSNYPAWA